MSFGEVIASILGAVAAIIGALTPWAVAWINKKIRDNELANQEIIRKVEANRKATEEETQRIAKSLGVVHDLLNGRTQKLIDHIEELEEAASLAEGKEALVKELRDLVSHVKISMLEATVEAKRLLAEAATTADELLKHAKIESERTKGILKPSPSGTVHTDEHRP